MRMEIIIIGLCLSAFAEATSMADDSLTYISGIVYDEDFHPLPYTHVISLESHRGDVTDTLGIFFIPYLKEDTLLFRNISFLDTLIAVSDFKPPFIIRLRKRYYPLPEAKIFEWGSSYGDFKEAFTKKPVEKSLGEQLGLPRQDPDYIPFDMDEAQLKSLGFAIKKPVSYMYYNLSKYEKSRRKVYRLEKNRDKIAVFESTCSPQNISYITGLSGSELERFLVYVNEKMNCDFSCSEFEILSEIHILWDVYSSMQRK